MYLVANYIAFLSPPLQVMRRENNFLLSAGGLKGALPFAAGEMGVWGRFLSTGMM